MQIISNDIQPSPGHEISLVTGFSARQRDGSPEESSLAMWIQWSLSYVLTVLQFPSPESSTCRLLSFALSLAIAYRYDAVSLSICPMLRAKTTDITMQDILKSRRPRRHGISAERYISSTSPDMPLSRRAVCSGYFHPFTILEGAVTHKLVNYWSCCGFS
ncbi:hypothetical protein BJX68DRAFT_40008 [Aspergillus pseudodeflectus]|uniref:Transcription factor domain-containing protein n=1 Tax=Aspergillus pseudodeflectus TaxID=176178 RepID=A0ABR4KQQ3_9EURO